MKFGPRAAMLLVVPAFLGGCGDDRPYCEAHEILRDQHSSLCVSAHELAKRNTTAIIASQDELAAAEILLRQAFQALRPAFARVPRAASWNQSLAQVEMGVTNDTVIDAWRAGELAPTSIQALDDTVAAMDVWQFKFDPLGARFGAEFISRGAVSAKNVQLALAAVPGVEVYVYEEDLVYKGSDIVDEGIDEAGDHRVLFMIGWEDCPPGCRFAHFWRVAVAPDGSARQVADWGDVVPAWVAESYAMEEDTF